MNLLYRGSVKDLRGPITLGAQNALVFDYSDAYSVFDWGRMPDLLAHKGESLAILAASLFEKLERPETWQEFSKSAEALSLRKGNRFGAAFNELGELLKQTGLKTHYLGVLPEGSSTPVKTSDLPEGTKPFKQIAVRQVSVVKPASTTVLGRGIPDYTATRLAPLPRLVPLEVIFRFGCPEGSSLLERTARDPGYLASIGFAGLEAKPGAKWEFPVLELFTKLESSDRPLTLSEALAISGVEASVLQDLLFRTAWVAGWLKFVCAKAGVELADGKLEWAVDESGQCMLVDAVGPDELRILKDGFQLSKEFLRGFYRKTPWYEALTRAKAEATQKGVAEWKRLVAEGPPALPAGHRELGSQVYQALANELTGRRWFSQAWPLSRVMETFHATGKDGGR